MLMFSFNITVGKKDLEEFDFFLLVGARQAVLSI